MIALMSLKELGDIRKRIEYAGLARLKGYYADTGKSLLTEIDALRTAIVPLAKVVLRRHPFSIDIPFVEGNEHACCAYCGAEGAVQIGLREVTDAEARALPHKADCQWLMARTIMDILGKEA